MLAVAACEALWCRAALGGGAGVCTGARMQPGLSGLGGDEGLQTNANIHAPLLLSLLDTLDLGRQKWMRKVVVQECP